MFAYKASIFKCLYIIIIIIIIRLNKKEFGFQVKMWSN